MGDGPRACEWLGWKRSGGVTTPESEAERAAAHKMGAMGLRHKRRVSENPRRSRQLICGFFPFFITLIKGVTLVNYAKKAGA